ncbi:MAG: OmpA family protein [Pseudomonadales bacterium]|nr:OmpA family protein [Pseudomonadales bacterium]
MIRVVLGLILLSVHSLADASSRIVCGGPLAVDADDQFHACVVINAGIGLSQFSPNTADSSWSIDNDQDIGFRLSAEYYFSRYSFLEAGYVDLGSAEFTNSNTAISATETISYKTPAVFIGSSYSLPTLPVDILAKIGVASVSTSSSSDLLLAHEDASAQFAWGLGLRYFLSTQWALKADFEAFSEDSHLSSLSISYLFGGRTHTANRQNKSSQVIQAAAAPIVIAEADSMTEIPADTDADGVIDTQDRCVTAQHLRNRVNQYGCVKYTGTFVNSQFASGSYAASINTEELDRYLSILIDHPDTQLNIIGHTDNIGSEADNLALSQRRADTVKAYLVKLGINAEQLITQALGEGQPIASNTTATGREKNRRVELQVLSQDEQ